MFDSDKKKEADNMKAVFVGLFLIILIATITVFKSNSEKKDLPVNKSELPQTETIDSTKVTKITPEELAKKIQLGSDLILLDFRNENQYNAEHIIDSVNLPSSKMTSLSELGAKNKTHILIEESGDIASINAIANLLAGKGYEELAYLDGGFESWKKKFNPTISDGDQKSFTDQAKVKYISSDELKKQIETENGLIIIDVRKNTDFIAGH
jgi:rhodanese-related sulfurtransferase